MLLEREMVVVGHSYITLPPNALVSSLPVLSLVACFEKEVGDVVARRSRLTQRGHRAAGGALVSSPSARVTARGRGVAFEEEVSGGST